MPDDVPVSRTRDPLAVRRAVAGVLSWALFAVAWWLVLRRNGAGVPDAVLVLPGTALLAVAVTTAWVQHNRGIYRRKGPRRAVPVLPAPPAEDRLGRPLHLGDAAHVLTAQEVVVDVVAGRKSYRVAA